MTGTRDARPHAARRHRDVDQQPEPVQLSVAALRRRGLSGDRRRHRRRLRAHQGRRRLRHHRRRDRGERRRDRAPRRPLATGPVAAAPPVNTHVPVIQSPSPVIQQGVTLTVTGFAWDSTADTTYSISWERCDAGGCQTISGATGAQYTLRRRGRRPDDRRGQHRHERRRLGLRPLRRDRGGDDGRAALEDAAADLRQRRPRRRHGDRDAGHLERPGRHLRHHRDHALHQRLRPARRANARRTRSPTAIWARSCACARRRPTPAARATVWSARYVGPVISAQAAGARRASLTQRAADARCATRRATHARASAKQAKREGLAAPPGQASRASSSPGPARRRSPRAPRRRRAAPRSRCASRPRCAFPRRRTARCASW